jgi:hypothetical protein
MKHLEYIEDGDRYYLVLKNPTQEEKQKFIEIAKQMFDVSSVPEKLEEMKPSTPIDDKVVEEKRNTSNKNTNVVENVNNNVVNNQNNTNENKQSQSQSSKPQRMTTGVFTIDDFTKKYNHLRKNQPDDYDKFINNAITFFNKNYFSQETNEKIKEIVTKLFGFMGIEKKMHKTINELSNEDVNVAYNTIKNIILKLKKN